MRDRVAHYERAKLAMQLRIASQRVWRQVPLGMRLKIAVHRMLAQIHKGIGEAIVAVLAEHGLDVPRDASGRIDRKDPAVAELGRKIYDKVRGVLRGRSADIDDVMHDTFTRVFLEKKSFLSLKGQSFSDYRRWILTVFHNAAKSHARSLTNLKRKRQTIDSPDPDQPDDRRKLEMLETEIRDRQRVPWEKHPMWTQVVGDIERALEEFDRKGRSPDAQYEFPTKRVFELMVRDGLSAARAAKKLVEEGQLESDATQARHALKRFKKQLDKVVRTVLQKIEDRDLLDSFFDTIAA